MGSRKEQTKDIPYTFPKYWNSHAFEKNHLRQDNIYINKYLFINK